jgi:hypothetical protein
VVGVKGVGYLTSKAVTILLAYMDCLLLPFDCLQRIVAASVASAMARMVRDYVNGRR